jgi:hypothetical protein
MTMEGMLYCENRMSVEQPAPFQSIRRVSHKLTASEIRLKSGTSMFFSRTQGTVSGVH